MPRANGQPDTSELPPNDFNHPYFKELEGLDFLYRPAPRGVLIRCRIRVHAKTLALNDYELRIEGYKSLDQPLLSTTPKNATTGVYLWLHTHVYIKHSKSFKAIKIGKLESNFARKKVKVEFNLTFRNSKRDKKKIVIKAHIFSY
jgi:hypothetical protein